MNNSTIGGTKRKVANALAMTGIKPQFIIAAYALAILLTRSTFAQAAVFGLVSAAVIQINTSIPGLNFIYALIQHNLSRSPPSCPLD